MPTLLNPIVPTAATSSVAVEALSVTSAITMAKKIETETMHKLEAILVLAEETEKRRIISNKPGSVTTVSGTLTSAHSSSASSSKMIFVRSAENASQSEVFDTLESEKQDDEFESQQKDLKAQISFKGKELKIDVEENVENERKDEQMKAEEDRKDQNAEDDEKEFSR